MDVATRVRTRLTGRNRLHRRPQAEIGKQPATGLVKKARTTRAKITRKERLRNRSGKFELVEISDDESESHTEYEVSADDDIRDTSSSEKILSPELVEPNGAGRSGGPVRDVLDCKRPHSSYILVLITLKPIPSSVRRCPYLTF
jgi:hypothetical protein